MSYRFITLYIFSTLSIHSINAHSLQEKNSSFNNDNDLIASLYQEIHTPRYKKEVLPNDFSHLSHLTAFGNSTNQPPTYLRSLFKLFSNMLKSSHYVNAPAFSAWLTDASEQLSPYFALPASRMYITNSALYDATFADRFKTTVNSLLYSEFSNHYDVFRQDPAVFLSDISTNIIILAQEEMERDQLRQTLIRFCDIALSKLVWDPSEHENTWATTKKIAEQLATLLEHNILDDSNDLDDLYWTLLNRYCYFVELVATDMPESFYTSLRNDLHADNNIILFAITEQDYIAESKLSYMQRTLIEAETAAYRHRAGFSRN